MSGYPNGSSVDRWKTVRSWRRPFASVASWIGFALFRFAMNIRPRL